MTGDVVGVDTGGTFTDFAMLDAVGHLTVLKCPSTPASPTESVMNGLETLHREGNLSPGFALVHGTTVATNALLERRGAATGLLTTRGFRDVIAIGRQARADLYALQPVGMDCLLPSERRLEADERVDWQGEVLRPLDDLQVEAALDRFQQMGVESLAVCFLFSYLNPQHEQRVGLLARRRGFNVSLSSEICPEPREFERTSTVAANALVGPVVAGYLDSLSTRLSDFGCGGFRIMQSSGGALSHTEAASHAIKTALSGPAAGVVAAGQVGREAGYPRLLTFDMGGTSTDVALVVDGQCALSTSGHVSGIPLLTPMLDIHTVGAGGGSLVRVDGAGALRVGPQSAGADPGPAAYGRGDALTVTDAHVLLGRLPESVRLAGCVPLDHERVHRLVERLAAELGCTPTRAALGVLAVANAAMSRALSTISLQRGHDPSDFALLSFGGAGGLHACELAASLGMRTVVIPRYPGAFSALGLAVADVRRESVRSLPAGMRLASGAPRLGETLSTVFQDLTRQAAGEMAGEGFGPGSWHVEAILELRYVGQSSSLRVPVGDPLDLSRARQRFHLLHRERYGHADLREPVEVTAARIVAVGEVKRPPVGRAFANDAVAEPHMAPVHETSGVMWARVLSRSSLSPDQERMHGPCIVVQDDATTYVPPGWSLAVDVCDNLVLRRID